MSSLHQEEFLNKIDQDGVGANDMDDEGNTLLHNATEVSLRCVEEVLRMKADPNKENAGGETALCWAVFDGNIPITKALLDANADPNVVLDEGNSLLHAAANSEEPAMLLFLHEYKSSKLPLNLLNANRENALHIACEAGNYMGVSWLLKSGADPLKGDEKNQLPIHVAARYCESDANLDLLLLLLQKAPKEQLTFRDSNSKLPEDIATDNAKTLIKSFQDLQQGCFNELIHCISGNVTRYPNWKPATAFYVMFVFHIFLLSTFIHAIFYIDNSLMKVGFCLCILAAVILYHMLRNLDPGYVPTLLQHEQERFMDHFEKNVEAGKTSELDILNRVVIPPRAVYCKEVEKCVRRYDHYSILIGTPIGLKNVIRFFLFCVSVTIGLGLYVAICFYTIRDKHTDVSSYYISLFLGLVATCVFLFFCRKTFNLWNNLKLNNTEYDIAMAYQVPWRTNKGENVYDLQDWRINLKMLYDQKEVDQRTHAFANRKMFDSVPTKRDQAVNISG